MTFCKRSNAASWSSADLKLLNCRQHHTVPHCLKGDLPKHIYG